MRTQLLKAVGLLYHPLRLLFSVEQLDMLRLTRGRYRHRNLRPVFTPASTTIASLMVDIALQKIRPRIKTASVQQPVRFLDPACGDGVFIAAILDRTKNIAGQLIGLERDAWQHKRCVHKYRFLNIFKEKQGIIAHANFLDDKSFQRDQKFDAIISFPPPYRAEYRQHFIHAAEKLLSPGGVLVMLMPLAAFDGGSFMADVFKGYLQYLQVEVMNVGEVTSYPIPYTVVVYQNS